MVGAHVLKVIPQLTAVALLYAQQQLHASASSDENMESERSTIDGEVFQGNMMRHLFPNSENIFKINDLVTIY
ncbi:hypothetical protein MTR_6g061610 [Medicago truncatula]|uniref:Uncharacterized protein n=1 Tax=Medicago truncatula TaxID=3880 RepID=G7KNF2_MEDTR|nr:hypothetical protein MTR_6g061610 [Medicago truncatula]